MNRINDKVRAECQRLRVEERLSIERIRERLHLSKGAISGIIKEHKLTPEEIALRRTEPWNKGTRKYKAEESWYHRLATQNKLSGNQTGKVAEAAVLLRLCAHGFSVYQSQFDGDRLDWLIETSDGRLIRIQVKQAYHCHRGMPVVSVRRPESKKYVEGDFDVIVGYDLYSDVAYVFKWEEVKGKTAISASEESKEAWHKLTRA